MNARCPECGGRVFLEQRAWTKRLIVDVIGPKVIIASGEAEVVEDDSPGEYICQDCCEVVVPERGEPNE